MTILRRSSPPCVLAGGSTTVCARPWPISSRSMCQLPAWSSIPLLFGLPLGGSRPLHIAFLEMVIDPVCSIVFEAEGEEAGTTRRPPRAPVGTALYRRICNLEPAAGSPCAGAGRRPVSCGAAPEPAGTGCSGTSIYRAGCD